MKLILQSTLRSLGITEKYAGFSLAVTAISLCFERPSRLRSVTKEVYWETAELHGCNRSDVERNIRTVIHHAWKVNRPGLQALSEYPLLAPPSGSDFLQIMVSHLKKALLPLQGTNAGEPVGQRPPLERR